MSVWYALATLLVATTRTVASLSITRAPFWCTPSHITPATSTAHTLRHSAAAMRSTTARQQGDTLWWRRRRRESASVPGVSMGLSPVEAGSPEVAPHGQSTFSLGDGDEGKDLSKKKGRRTSNTRGLLLLSTVPLVWGTYGPSVKYLYQMGEPTPGLVFNFGCYVVSVFTLGVVARINNARNRRHDGETFRLVFIRLFLFRDVYHARRAVRDGGVHIELELSYRSRVTQDGRWRGENSLAFTYLPGVVRG